MKIQVEYEQHIVFEQHSKRQYGPWTKAYESKIKGVTPFDDEKFRVYNADVFLIPDDSEYAYVIYMIYSDGDSFGRATGKIDVLHVTNDADRAKFLGQLFKANENDFKFVDDFDRPISISNYASDYFSSVEQIIVEKFAIGDTKNKWVF